MDAMTDEVQHTDPTATEQVRELVILLYASDRTVRENVRFTLGRKVAADLPPDPGAGGGHAAGGADRDGPRRCRPGHPGR